MANTTAAVFENEFGPASTQRQLDFTTTFEQSILSILPSGLFLCFAVVVVWRLRTTQTPKTNPHTLRSLKLIATLANVVLNVAYLTYASWEGPRLATTVVPAAAIGLLASMAIVGVSTTEHQHSIKPSTLLITYLLLSAAFDAIQIRTFFFVAHARLAILMSISLAVKLAILISESIDKRSILQEPYKSYPPEATASVINRSFFWWLNRLFRTGFAKILTTDDLFGLDPELYSSLLAESMIESWDSSGTQVTKRTLPKRVFRCLWKSMMRAAPARLCLTAFTFCQPFLITATLSTLNEPQSAKNRSKGYGLIGAAFLIYVGIAISTAHYRQRFYRCLTMFRGAMGGLIYHHSLQLHDQAKLENPAITLMSTDIDTIVESLVEINEIWANVIEVILGIGLLARKIGAICVVPIVLICICSYAQSFVAKRIGAKRMGWNRLIQSRVSLTSSMLSTIKAIRAMGISRVLASALQKSRLEELSASSPFMWMIVLLNILASTPTIWAPVVTFLAYMIQAKLNASLALSAEQVFSSLALLSLITRPALSLLATIPVTAASLGCFERIQGFLLLPVRHDQRTISPAHSTEACQPENGRKIASVTETETNVQSTEETSHVAVEVSDFCLRATAGGPLLMSGLRLTIRKGSFTTITGPVGCGKTSLLKAILGDLPCDRGSITVSSKNLAYCGQKVWLPNLSIHQTICQFSSPTDVDEGWYERVLRACALDQDLAELAAGDATVIGSRGAMLSGGQQQRVSLARALYSRLPVIILDDTLSALDARTEAHLLSHCFGRSGICKAIQMTVILATQSIRCMATSDEVIAIDAQSFIRFQGAYSAMNSDTKANLDLVSLPVQDDHSRERHAPAQSAPPGPPAPKNEDFARKTGDVTLYLYYIRSFGWRYALLFLVSYTGFAFAKNFPQIWLEWWTRNEADVSLYAAVYVLLAAMTVVFSAGSMCTTFLHIMPASAIELHEKLLKSVMHAPQTLFDLTDAGVILNMFSQDMALITMPLTVSLHMAGQNLFNCLAQVALIGTGSAYMSLSIPLVLAAVYVIQKIYLRTSRQLRLLDLEARAPLYTHFTETIEGVATIRAFGWEGRFNDAAMEKFDASQTPYYMLFCAQRWLQLVLDMIVAALAVLVIALAFSLRSGTTAGLLGVALNNILNFSQSLSAVITSWTSLETSLGAIARIRSFVNSTPNESTRRAPSVSVPPTWPTMGRIELRDVTVRYANTDRLALDSVNICIEPGQKIGICGRTGSGKSTLMGVILGLVPFEGTILIDGVDTRDVPPELLRERLTAIPQNTFTLAGSVRLNANPTATATDKAIKAALMRVGLWKQVENRVGLDADMPDLSAGELQLFFLARGLLRNSQVILLDEATSQVDSSSDGLMQDIMRTQFRDHTVVTIAHKLETIIESDFIVLLDDGRVAECDSPETLLSRPSKFKDLYELRNMG